ncbi:MAG: beta-lactamase family protein [Actinomycetota bacterium]|nr:beta-lactamase family protein [Actinomycetota bacterium]
MTGLSEIIDDILRPSGDESAPAGAVLAVRRGDDVDVAIGGFRELAALSGETDLAMEREASFDLASVSKMFTTVALMRLVTDREVALDNTLGHWVPSAVAAAGVSIRQLLLHRGGLAEWTPLYVEATERDAAFAHLDHMPLRYLPESGRHYSDLGFMMLGRVVENVTGQPLDTAIAELVIEPLGLASSRYRHPVAPPVAAASLGDAIEARMLDTGVPYPVPYTAADFTGWRSGVLRDEVNDGNAFHALDSVSGHAGLFSTPDDLLAFAAALSSGKDELWSPDIAQQFFTQGPDVGQALGFRRYAAVVDGRETQILGHTGFTGCMLGFVPDEEVAIVLATNRLHTLGTPAATDRLVGMALTALETGVSRR